MTNTDITKRNDVTTRPAVNDLKAGDRVEIDHEVKVGSQRWRTVTVGAVERVERRRHGLHFRRNPDDKVFSDLIILKLDDGSLTTITLDEYTRLNRLG
jgi:hypothetical protein